MTETTDPDRDVLLAEILEQPQAILAAGAGLEEQAEAFEQIRRAAASRPGQLLLTGMGSSYDALTSLATVLGGHGLPANALNTAELIRFRAPLTRSSSLVLAVSQSGRSAELVRLAAAHAADPSAVLVSVTNGRGNPLADAADVSLDLCAGPELGPATKTYACTTVVLAAICGVLTAPDRPVGQVLADVRRAAVAAGEHAESLLARRSDLLALLAAWYDGRAGLALVGRGRAVGTAEVGALVLKEAAHLPAWAMDAAEFRHGPLELAGPDLAMVLVSLEDSTTDLDARLLHDVAGRGASVLSVGHASRSGSPHIPTPAVDPLLDTALAAIPLQLLAWWLAQQRNPHPGRFVAGSKVTTTE